MQPASSVAGEAQWSDLVAAVSAATDLEATARSSGALVRRWEIRSGEMLLRLALDYGPGGLSLRAAAAWAGFSGLANLSDAAVMKRLRRAAAHSGARGRVHRPDWLQATAPVQRRRRAGGLEPIFGALASSKVTEQAVLVDYSGQGRRSRGKATFPTRLIVLRLSPEAAERAAKAVHRKYSRRTAGKLLLPVTVRTTGYLMLLTSRSSSIRAAEVP